MGSFFFIYQNVLRGTVPGHLIIGKIEQTMS